MIDQGESPPEGWQLWMERQIDEADFVLMVCIATYRRRKVEIHKQVFHFPTRVARRQLRLVCSEPQKNKESGRSAASSRVSGSRCIGNVIPNQKALAAGGHRRGTTSSVLVAARWPVLK